MHMTSENMKTFIMAVQLCNEGLIYTVLDSSTF